MHIRILVASSKLDRRLAEMVQRHFGLLGEDVEIEEASDAHNATKRAFAEGQEAVLVLMNQAVGSPSYGMYVPITGSNVLFESGGGQSSMDDDAFTASLPAKLGNLLATARQSQ